MNPGVIDEKSVFNNYKLDAHVAFAFQEDCEDFLKAFKELSTFKFIEFAQLWKEKVFIAIFQNCSSIVIMEQFLENAFLIVKKFLFVCNIFKQVGCLYMLYAIYYKQPVKNYVKIRLIIKECKRIEYILTNLKSKKAYEPMYVFYKLMFDEAFIFCALPERRGLHSTYINGFNLFTKHVIGEISYCPIRKFKELRETDDDVAKLIEYDKLYREKINQYAEISTELIPFSSILDDLKGSSNEKPENRQRTETEELKKKAIETTNAVYRADRQVLTALSLDQSSSLKSSKSS